MPLWVICMKWVIIACTKDGKHIPLYHASCLHMIVTVERTSVVTMETIEPSEDGGCIVLSLMVVPTLLLLPHA